MKNLSTRIRIVALIIAISLPILGLTVLNATRERAVAETKARNEISRLAQLVAAHQDRIIESSRQLLKTIAQAWPMLLSDPQRCNQYLAKLMQANKDRYRNIGILNTEGRQICSAFGIDPNLNISDRHYFRDALRTGEFTIGEYQIGRVTKKPGINFGFPITDSEGTPIAVAFLSLDLNDFNREYVELSLPDYIRLTIIDRNNTVLARHPPEPERLGKPFKLPIVSDNLQTTGQGIFESRGADDVDRLFAFSDIARNSDNTIALRVLVSAPGDIIYAQANANLLRAIAEILLISLLLIAGAWYGAEWLVLSKIRALLHVSERIRQGDLRARTGMPNSRDELNQIGYAFDEMALALQERDAKLGLAVQELQEQASTDALTGLHNRRHFREMLQRELTRAKRNGTALALVMVDVDYFKKINDTYGHTAGDLVLREIGTLFKNNIRADDVACRFGGEEFSLILAESTCEGARLRAEVLRLAVNALELDYEGKTLGKLTASFGVAMSPDHAGDPDALLRAADEALYAAKGAGRNRVMIHDSTARLHPASLESSIERTAI